MSKAYTYQDGESHGIICKECYGFMGLARDIHWVPLHDTQTFHWEKCHACQKTLQQIEEEKTRQSP